MNVSARNLIPGTIKSLTLFLVNQETVNEISPGIEVVSVITKHSVEAMDLKVGTTVEAMIKASNVMLAID